MMMMMMMMMMIAMMTVVLMTVMMLMVVMTASTFIQGPWDKLNIIVTGFKKMWRNLQFCLAMFLSVPVLR